MLAPSSGGYHPHAQVLWPCLLAMFFQFGLSARSWLDESPFYTISPDVLRRHRQSLTKASGSPTTLLRLFPSLPIPSMSPTQHTRQSFRPAIASASTAGVTDSDVSDGIGAGDMYQSIRSQSVSIDLNSLRVNITVPQSTSQCLNNPLSSTYLAGILTGT
ncbi:hypothetical protein C8R47DRAFT_1201018 [Mycena vitilis]|nr:hypothetical protein C8R47DRAFT_1201018 [Mycena vitilis]